VASLEKTFDEGLAKQTAEAQGEELIAARVGVVCGETLREPLA
jgi:hypothetical protein